ncbi:MAG: hypothetical protein ABI136_06825, partial [Ginsengibacter sp.]
MRKLINKVLVVIILLIPTQTNARNLKQNPMQENPSLIPLPQSVKWTQDVFQLDKCAAIFINDRSLQDEALRWNKMTGKNIPVKVISKIVIKENYSIQLGLEKVTVPYGEDEAYHLVVKN